MTKEKESILTVLCAWTASTVVVFFSYNYSANILSESIGGPYLSYWHTWAISWLVGAAVPSIYEVNDHSSWIQAAAAIIKHLILAAIFFGLDYFKVL